MRLILLLLVLASGCKHFQTEVAVSYRTPDTEVSVKVYK